MLSALVKPLCSMRHNIVVPSSMHLVNHGCCLRDFGAHHFCVFFYMPFFLRDQTDDTQEVSDTVIQTSANSKYNFLFDIRCQRSVHLGSTRQDAADKGASQTAASTKYITCY